MRILFSGVTSFEVRSDVLRRLLGPGVYKMQYIEDRGRMIFRKDDEEIFQVRCSRQSVEDFARAFGFAPIPSNCYEWEVEVVANA